MDHDAGRSTTSGSLATLLGHAVSACTINFQGHRSLRDLHDSLQRYALLSVGLTVKVSPNNTLLTRHEVLCNLPRALAPASFKQRCLGVLADFIRSDSDVETYASLFCNNDCDLTLSQINSCPTSASESAQASPSESTVLSCENVLPLLGRVGATVREGPLWASCDGRS